MKPNNNLFKILTDYTWFGNICLAYDLVTILKPKKVVELGTYMGTSFFSMCQAVKDSKLDTTLIAVDSWQGEEHTGFYSEDIYQGFVKKLEENYKEVKT